MNSKLRVIEVLFMIALILAFATTGIFIIQEKNDYAMLSLTSTSLIALIEFYLVLTGRTGKVIDLRGATNRNPKGSYANNDYSDPFLEEDFENVGKSVHSLEAAKSFAGKNKKRTGKTISTMRNTGSFSGDSGRFSSEGVGNMRVYQRGEKIDYAHSDDLDEDW